MFAAMSRFPIMTISPRARPRGAAATPIPAAIRNAIGIDVTLAATSGHSPEAMSVWPRAT
jgi:hypothetical protein